MLHNERGCRISSGFQHSGCFLGFLLFWCRRSTLLRHCFSILAVFLGFCCSGAGDPPFSGTVSAFWLFSWVSAVLLPEIHPSPALLQHSGCFLGILLFWCRRSTLLRHCFSILIVFLGFCCSAAGDPPFSGTASAFWLFSWDSAVLLPEIHPSPALLQHSGCFLGFLLFCCRRSTLLRHCFSILAVFILSDEQEAVAQATASCCKNQLCNLQKSYRIIHSSQSEPFRRVRVS